MSYFDYILQDHKVRFPKLDIIHIIGHYFFTPGFKIILRYRAAQYFQKKNKILYNIQRLRLINCCNKYDITIDPELQIGTGVKFPHGGPFVLNPNAKIGKNCTIHPNVLIGGNRPKGAPIIGDNCYIGNGAKIIGPVNIGDWVYIAPGAIITKNVESFSLMGSGFNLLLNKDGKKHVEFYNT